MNISPANVALEIASFRNQALSSLMNLPADTPADSETTDFAQILGMKTAENSSVGEAGHLSDPDSAFRMMSQINEKEVLYKAQFAELSAMGNSVERLEMLGGHLSDIDMASGNTDIKLQLEEFVGQYNAWVARFAPVVETGGVLDDVQAAEISLYELEQSVKNIFNGAASGVDGLGDLGISIDAMNKRATLDTAKLTEVLASNKQGVVNAIDEFSANFIRSADLLNAADNFIPTQLDNRSRAIDYIADNKVSLQAEFGAGNSARPTDAVAKALAAYEQAFSIR